MLGLVDKLENPRSDIAVGLQRLGAIIEVLSWITAAGLDLEVVPIWLPQSMALVRACWTC